MARWEQVAEFTVWGQPKSKGRPRFTKQGYAYTPKTTRQAETAVLDAFEIECPLWEPTLEKVRLEVDIHYKGKAIGDGDNVYKLVSDALNGRAYMDDKQVRKGGFEVFEGRGNFACVKVEFFIFKGDL